MKFGAEDKKKLATLGIVGVFALGAAFYMYSQLFGGGEPTNPAAITPAPAVRTEAPQSKASGNTVLPTNFAGSRSRAATLTGAAALDPTLKMEPMLVTEALVYSGSGRNIFSMTSAPMLAAIPKPIAPARPRGPMVPVALVPSGPPPPPPIDLKFFGTATSGNGARQAFLLHGEDVFLASDGDIVQRRYKIIAISANSILVEDMTNNNKQNLPLLTN